MASGCRRWTGAVTPVPTRNDVVARAIPPSTDHTNALLPCAGTHGRDVVGDHRGAKAGLLRADRVVDQRVGRVFLTREPVAELEAIG